MNAQHYSLSRRHALQLLAGFSGGLLLHACGQSDSSAPKASKNGLTPVSIGGVPWIGLTPVYIAKEKGFFAEEGIDLDLNLFSANGEAITAFVAGNLDGMSAVSSEVIVIKSQGKDFKVVMVEDNSVGADGILARNSVASVADFKGKKVGVETSGTSYFFLLQVLKEAGLTKDDITPVNIDPAAAATAYESGNIDIAVSYAPFLQQANEAESDGRIIYDSSKMPTAIIDMYLFGSDFIDSNPEAVQGFVNGVIKGLAFLEENEEEGLAIAAKTLEIEPEALAADLAGIKLPDVVTNQEMLGDANSDLYIVNSLKDMATFLAAEEDIKVEPEEISDLIDPQFIQAVES